MGLQDSYRIKVHHQSTGLNKYRAVSDLDKHILSIIVSNKYTSTCAFNLDSAAQIVLLTGQYLFLSR